MAAMADRATGSPSGPEGSVTRARTRSTSAVVLPDPAPAWTKSVVSRADRTRWRAVWSGGRTSGIVALLAVGRAPTLRVDQVQVARHGRILGLGHPRPAEVGDAEEVGVAAPARVVEAGGG